MPDRETPTPHLSFFVYGTLRSGEPNHFYFGKAVVGVSEAVLMGAELWNLGLYPMAVWGTGEIYGELFEIAPEHTQSVLQKLDRLEGVNAYSPEKPGGLFHRERCHVLVRDALVEAWVYLGREDLARRGKMIMSGDWKKRKIGQGTP